MISLSACSRSNGRHSPTKLLLVLIISLSAIGFIDGFSSVVPRGEARSAIALGGNSHLVSEEESSIDGFYSPSVALDELTKGTNYRRAFLSQLVKSPLTATSISLLYPGQNANALPFIGGNDRRQLELCLVAILRTEYWAMNVAKSLNTKLLTVVSPSSNATDGATELLSDNQRKQPYLEARLGAKALLTQKIGGGANSRVRELGTLQLKECLDDIKYWCGELAKTNQLLPGAEAGSSSAKNAKRIICNNELATATEELIESLASIVEFDGLETTIDPSPRSSLMLSMYTPTKGTFVYRTLKERVIPSCERCMKIFGSERRRIVEEFVRRDHGDEVPFEILEKLYEEQQQQ